jgi:hypothetical protein
MRLVAGGVAAGDGQRCVTDRFDLPAAEVVSLYRKRRQIERFFRWLKHQPTLLRPFGTSRAALRLTVLIAACVAAIGSLIEADRPKADTRIAWLRGVGRAPTALPAEPDAPG